MAGQEHTSSVGPTERGGIRSALWLPLFDELADPVVVARSGRRGRGGRLGRVLRLGPPALAGTGPAGGRSVDHAGRGRRRHRTAAARARWSRPLARRRPTKLARETATLGPAERRPAGPRGRAGSDRFGGEFSQDRRGVGRPACASRMLDESLAVLAAAGPASRCATGARTTPSTASGSCPDRSAAGGAGLGRRLPGNLKPLRRAARHDGFFPVNLEHPDQLAEVVAAVTALRGAAPRPSSSPSSCRRYRPAP